MIDLARDEPQPRPRVARRACSTSPTCARVHSREAYDVAAGSTSATSSSTTVVRQSIAYAESAERAVSILEHRPDLGRDYLELADELLVRLDKPAARRKLKPLLNGDAPAG